MQDINALEIWSNMGPAARAILAALIAMSVYSVWIMADRLSTFVLERRRSARFATVLAERLGGRDLAGARALSRTAPQPVAARLIAAGLDEYARNTQAGAETVDAVDRAVARVRDREIAALRRGLGGLATIGSAAPFIGLLGTVVGIINAFRSMAASGQGGLAAVSGGIAEALVTTAFGLLVAIPAVMVYNHLTGRLEDLVVDLNDVSSELLHFVSARRPAPESPADA